MPKPSHCEKLLAEGLQVVLEQGYGGASVRDIVQAAGVPQGSFKYIVCPIEVASTLGLLGPPSSGWSWIFLAAFP